jgi:hypothetical protein
MKWHNMHSPENPKPGQSPEALEARLRALPDPPVPAGLEARLLAAIPTTVATGVPVGVPVARQEWFAVASTIGALAAVCLLAIFARHAGDDTSEVPGHRVSPPPAQISSQPANEFAGVVLSPIDSRILKGAGMSTFRWPIQEISPIRASPSVPRGLLD